MDQAQTVAARRGAPRRRPLPSVVVAAAQDEEEGFDDAVDDVSYTVYCPKKLHIGVPHPDPVVENTSMAAVDPPELWYDLKLQVCMCVFTRVPPRVGRATFASSQAFIFMFRDGWASFCFSTGTRRRRDLENGCSLLGFVGASSRCSGCRGVCACTLKFVVSSAVATVNERSGNVGRKVSRLIVEDCAGLKDSTGRFNLNSQPHNRESPIKYFGVQSVIFRFFLRLQSLSLLPYRQRYDIQELEGEFDVVKSGKLSALQLEAIAYACQAHETRLPDGSRAGFFIGDGAGVSLGQLPRNVEPSAPSDDNR